MCVFVYLQECRLTSGAAARLSSAGGGGVRRSELAGHRLPSASGCTHSEGSGPAGGHIRYVSGTSREAVAGPIKPETFLSSFSPELFTTEVSHLRTLKVLDQVFFQKMRSVLSPEELACIFPNLPQVYDLHGQSAFPPSQTHLCFMAFLSLLFAQ